MKRASVIVLALVAASQFVLTATGAHAFAAKRNFRADEEGIAATRQQRAAQRPRRRARPVARPSARERVSPSVNGASATMPDSPIEVREINAEGLRGVFERHRSTANAARRPLLVNFWATWCIPCREEFPDLVRLDTEFRPRGLEFITVSLDDATERTTTVPAFLREMRATAIPAYLLNTPEPETAINAVDPTWSGALPATFLFDREGRIVYKHFGRITLAEVRAAIERALAAPTIINTTNSAR